MFDHDEGLFDGRFMLGVNYWPRHRAVRMWKDWAPDEIDAEFAEMESLGFNCARVFTVWDDFQPITELLGGAACPMEIAMRHDHNITPEDNPEMIDPVMVERFDKLLEIAGRHGIGLIVTLLVGWMSGMVLDVSWRNGRNIFTDPFMLKWESLYCRFFAKRYRGDGRILAWDLGNEQNCFMDCPSNEAAWNWTNTLVSVLKRYDPEHTVVSGMHGLDISNNGENTGSWSIRDVADCCDFTTVHPYPNFVLGGSMDEADDIRTALLAAAQNTLYQSLGGKPCMCQEFGSLGDSIMCEGVAADYARMTLYNLLAAGSLGALWWCHTDFTCCETVPYRWVLMENNGLGLFASDGRAKPASQEFKRFGEVVARLGGRVLPATVKRAAIVLPFKADDWRPLFSSYVLCKQAGIEAEFVDCYGSLSGYSMVILPSLTGNLPLEARQWGRIKEFVHNGGTLYASHQGCSLTSMTEVFGIDPVMRKKPTGSRKMKATGAMEIAPGILFGYNGTGAYELVCKCSKATPVLEYEDGRPAMTMHRYGRGYAVLLNEPIEMLLSQTPEAFKHDNSWMLYHGIRQLAGIRELAEVDDPFVQCTVHQAEGAAYIVIVNNSCDAKDVTVNCTLPPLSCKALSGHTVSHDGASIRLSLERCGAEVLQVEFEGALSIQASLAAAC